MSLRNLKFIIAYLSLDFPSAYLWSGKTNVGVTLERFWKQSTKYDGAYEICLSSSGILCGSFCWSYFKKDNEAKDNPDKDKNDQREKGLL